MADSLDPVAADRVLRRASELAGPDEHPVGRIDPEALIAAAADVGIPEQAVRRSLAIEHLGPAPSARRLDELVGAAVICDDRVVRAPAERVLDTLDRWLVGMHHLRRERRRPGVVLWTRRDDLVGTAKRTARGLTGEGRLGDVRWIRAEAKPVDDEETIVRVTIDRSTRRRSALVGSGALGAGGAAIGVTGLVLAAPFGFVAIPVVAAGGVVVWSGRTQAARFDRELVRLLDAVEQGDVPPGMLDGIRRRIAPRRTA